jgi:hypothetical protein
MQGDPVAGGVAINLGDPPKIYPGHSPGHLSVSGSFQLLSGAVLQLQVERQGDGCLAWDTVSAGSSRFQPGSAVQFEVGSGVADASWQALSFFDCGSGCSGANLATIVIDGAPGASISCGSDGGITLSIAPVQSVPEPQTSALWLAGLVWTVHRARRGGNAPSATPIALWISRRRS